ncbi:MAG: hypothetical protein ABH821_00645 [archaeon]
MLERGVNVFLSSLLLLFIAVVSIAVATQIGFPFLEETQNTIDFEIAANILRGLEENINEVSLLESGSSKLISIDLRDFDLNVDSDYNLVVLHHYINAGYFDIDSNYSETNFFISRTGNRLTLGLDYSNSVIGFDNNLFLNKGLHELVVKKERSQPGIVWVSVKRIGG